MLINLLQNAVDALKSTPMPRIIVSARAENGCAIVTVADNGAGVSEPAQKTLFEPFSTTKDNGMGMGLAISRTIIEAHEGRLSWAVSPGERNAVQLLDPAGASRRIRTANVCCHQQTMIGDRKLPG